MLTRQKTVAPNHEPAAPIEPGRTPAGRALPHTPPVGGGVIAASGAGEAQRTTAASPAPVLINARQVMFATAAAGTASPAAVTRRPWIVVLWQRLSLRSGAERRLPRHYPQRRALCIERAAMAREM